MGPPATPGTTGYRVIDRRSVLRAGLVGTAAFAAPMLLASCGRPGSAGSSGPLQFWNFYGPQSNSDPTIQAQSRWFEKTVQDWNDTHDRKIELVFVPGAAYLNGAKLPTAFAAGDGPDIFLISPGDFLRYANGDVLVDLSPHLTQAARDDFFPDALATRIIDGDVYGLPMEIEPLAMWYSPKSWEKAGLAQGDIPTTWDEMLTVGQKLQSPSRAGLVFEVTPGYYQNFTWYPWLWQGGGEVTVDGRSGLDSPAGRAALDLFGRAISSGVAPRTLPAAGDLISAFTADQAGMWESGIWNVASFRTTAPDTSIDVFKLPTPPGGKYVTALGGWAFVANAQGREPDVAAEFVVWALGSEDPASVERMVQWCTVAKSDIAPRRSALTEGEHRGGYDSPLLRKFKDDIFPGGRSEPRVPPVVYKSVSDAIQQVQLAGKAPAADAKTASEAINAYMTTYHGGALV